MTQDEINEELMGRFLAVQTPGGRWRLYAFVKWKRLSWQNVVHAALFLKRVFDITGSIIALILLSPVFPILAILVKLDGGPVFFRQKRVGLMGREFTMLKYRSMCVDAEAKLKDLLHKNELASGVTFQLKDDPRVTKIGKIFRKTSLDELPQFLNVLRGEMSLVRPRPPVPREVALYTQAYRRRLLVKPGITCLWQVGERRGGLLEIGNRHEIDFPEQVALDVRYIESHSVVRDLVILMKTVPAILFGKVA
ncbi:MAG: sugar transferase [Verrucomicrobia bacterium]|nr:sugar transferase [Verrucomicrobiota bacterium]